MKKHNLKLLSILVISPLLMANSPMPRPSTDRYDDIEVSIVYNQKTFISNNTKTYEHTVTIKNTGDKYIASNYYLYVVKEEQERHEYSLSLSRDNDLFYRTSIRPGLSEATLYYPEEIIDETKFKSYYTECYSILDEDVTFEGPGSLTLLEDKMRNNYYPYAVAVTINNLGDWDYDIVLDATYKGEEYSVVLNKNDKTLTTYERLDVDQFQVHGYHAFRGNYKRNNDLFYGLYIFGQVFFWCFIIAIFLGLAAAIAVPVSIHAHRRKRLKRELENKE